MRDTAPSTPVPDPHVPHSLEQGRPQPASPAVINMDDSLNETKETQRKTDTEESMLETSSAVSDNPEETTHAHDSDLEPMDISNKTNTTADSDHRSTCSSPNEDTKYFCPICEISLTSQHEFTLHIRSHNNDNDIIPEKGFTCCICSKVLSSSSSLDRHTLVHSGERPFRCKICSVTFTTNGNMHRHMRTHSQKSGENYESDGSTDSNSSTTSTTKSRKRRLEFNNNNKLMDNSNKRKSDSFTSDNDDNGNSRRKTKNLNNNNINEVSTQKYHCPVCDREDFASLNVLQTHMEDNHPYFEVRCATCNLSFKNHRALNLHRHMVHYTESSNNLTNKNNKNLHVGFNDLTFVDFSSKKFPHIARYECERNIHKPVTVQKFVCDKCSKAFPCSSSLEIHQEDCLKNPVKTNEFPTDLSKTSHVSDEETYRENFFAHLNLQNKSTPASPTSIKVEEEEEEEQQQQHEKVQPDLVSDTKDLADIQSILSMTSNGSLLQHLRTKPPSELLQCPESIRTAEQPAEEETQDVFAAEFRKMKLRGEFPCRLCTAVFPNLRALKGHNRAHLTGAGNTGPYRCNMCPHSSIDKAALIRHMRTHNGDRPYECSLCNYAFTTKANCERHLRNRHAKVTREEVKKAIIYHPSEDPTNDEINKLAATRSEPKHSFASPAPVEEESRTSDKTTTPSTKERVTPELRNIMLPQNLGIISPSLISKDLSMNLSVPKDPSPTIKVSKDITNSNSALLRQDKSPFDFRKRINLNYQPEIPDKLLEDSLSMKSADGLKQIPDYDTHSDGEDSSNNMSSSFEEYPKTNDHPMDLSMDVLDLSTKKDPAKVKSEDEPHDFTKKTLESASGLPPTPTAAQLLLAQQFLKNPANLYFNPLSQYYLSNMNIPHSPYPFFIPPPFINTPEMKERMLRLQLSGGTMISDQFSSLTSNGIQPFHQQNMPNISDIKYSIPKAESEIKLPLHINTQLGENITKLQSPKPPPKNSDLSQSPNSVKMVIKNGVLMPKQKQRRYRTERPFSCEHCSARFTLRSNMERHIKQQHPQYWSQRQRAGLTGVGRKPSSTPPATAPSASKTQYYDLNIPNYDIPKMQDSKETKDKDANINRNISQQVKYAILAQQLKTHSSEASFASSAKDKLAQEEDEDALVIDEESTADKFIKQEAKDTVTEVRRDPDKLKSLDMKMQELRQLREKEVKAEKSDEGSVMKMKTEESGQDLVPVSRLLDNAVSSQLPFQEYFRREGEENEVEGVSEEDEEGLVASGSTSEGNGSGSDENKSENETAVNPDTGKKKSAYSLAPNRVSCPYCHRKFPWTSSLRRHVLTHTGQKPFKCPQCPLLFTTKSNCDRHLLRKHGNNSNSNSDSTNNNNNNNNSQNYMMRNVPERPYKCSSCPSSTFATLSNLKKHMSCKHTTATVPVDQQQPRPDEAKSSNEGEGPVSSEDERANKLEIKSEWETQIAHSAKVSAYPDGGSAPNADLPFKCHLCEGSYAERQEALDHIKEMHMAEYSLLLAKGALDQPASGHDDVHTSHETEEDDHLRGRFPDYANRKVMCAFCMRRFWSAEDLRRHMRTHTGERPFSCDVCNRRFTLKHSMLRHRKKHNLSSSPEDAGIMISGDEDGNRESPYEKYTKVNNNNSLVSKVAADKSSEEDSEGNEGNDLIGNLLGIRDKSIIDQVLISSADDAAKLLGVNRGQE